MWLLRKKKARTCLFIFGLILCLSPFILAIHNGHVATSLISTFKQDENLIGKDKLYSIFEKAKKYNDQLFYKQEREKYEDVLNYSSTQIMASIEIPVISMNLPIYHGTSEEVLNSGAGHFSFSSLPVGGKNTHCLLTGHRGLPNAKLFTRIDELKEKDLIYIHVCKKELVYEVEKIYVIKPEEILDIQIESNKDLLSLITCTPYGINTKRLVVQAKRVKEKKVKDKNIRFSYSIREALFVVAPIFLLLFVIFRKKGNFEK